MIQLSCLQTVCRKMLCTIIIMLKRMWCDDDQKKSPFCIKHVQWKYIIAANNLLSCPYLEWKSRNLLVLFYHIYYLLRSQQKRRFARHYRHSPVDGKHWNRNRKQQVEGFKIRSAWCCNIWSRIQYTGILRKEEMRLFGHSDTEAVPYSLYIFPKSCTQANL